MENARGVIEFNNNYVYDNINPNLFLNIEKITISIHALLLIYNWAGEILGCLQLLEEREKNNNT